MTSSALPGLISKRTPPAEEGAREAYERLRRQGALPASALPFIALSPETRRTLTLLWCNGYEDARIALADTDDPYQHEPHFNRT